MMLSTYEPGYQQLHFEDENEDTPHEGVQIHVVPEGGKTSKWNHIENLDKFFTRVYEYHQGNGFIPMLMTHAFEIFRFCLVIFLGFFLFQCVDYDLLFGYNVPTNITIRRLKLWDVVYPYDVWLKDLSWRLMSILFLASLVLSGRVFKIIQRMFHFWDVKAFFNTALNIKDVDLENYTWHDIQKRLREVQVEQQMCIHKKELTELDIYHRILRQSNYMVAMFNKGLLPPRFNIPLVGEFIYMTDDLKRNMEYIIFRCPWAPFEHSWQLKEDFKKASKRNENISKLKNLITWFFVVTLVCAVVIIPWNILSAAFSYVSLFKRDLTFFGLRRWSMYARYYVRHFNELDHELNARLNRAYRPAGKYMNSFSNPITNIICQNVAFLFGALGSILVLLMLKNLDVVMIEDYGFDTTVILSICSAFVTLIPDENQVIWPEHLLSNVLAHLHYVPSHWKGKAHTKQVRAEFANLFHYKLTFILLELFSPIITPFVLFFYVRPRAGEFVDFLRLFTVEVSGVGDVCSFAQMDIRANGDPDWNPGPRKPSTTDQTTQAEDGKLELSLIHFSHTNPEWKPPSDDRVFISTVKEEARKKLIPGYTTQIQAFGDQSLSSLTGSTLFGPVDTFVNSYMSQTHGPRCVRVTRLEGPVDRLLLPPGGGGGGALSPSLGASVFGNEFIEDAVMDMSISTLYLHQVHRRGVERRFYSGPRNMSGRNLGGNERSPLLSS